MEEVKKFKPCLCVTHDCNLHCTYCYQKHAKNLKMPFSIAKQAIDWIFDNVPIERSNIEVDFIGGEPLLEFDLIKEIVAYTDSKKPKYPYSFFASTNGTLLTDEMKTWFSKHKNSFVLGLSLDGAELTHNHNRSNLFNAIDINFFKSMWPEQKIKVTLSEFSLHHLADNIKYLHSLGFTNIGGVNLFEGDFDWSKDEYVTVLVPQLKELVQFYLENENLPLNQMFDKQINYCETKSKERKKWCGIGVWKPFFDVDGSIYPCSFVTPMTFTKSDIDNIQQTDFTNDENFIDDDCFQNCYIYPICPTCFGANYLVSKNFKERNKSKCRIQKLISLFIADLQAKKIEKSKGVGLDDTTLYYTIEAIKKIRGLYLEEFRAFL